MHEHLRSFKYNPTQKFHQNFINFEKPQKLGQNAWNHDEWMKKRHTRGRKCSLRSKNTWVKRFGVWERGLGRWEDENYRERSRRNEENSHGPYIKKNIKLDGSRGVERCRALKCVNYLLKSYQGFVERCPQQKGLDGLISYRASKKFLDGSSRYQEAIKNAIKEAERAR